MAGVNRGRVNGWLYRLRVQCRPLGILQNTSHNPVMRQIGTQILGQAEQRKIAEALRWAALQFSAAESLPTLPTTGHIKGVYRFKTHEEMNRHSEHALSIAIAANLRRREHSQR